MNLKRLQGMEIAVLLGGKSPEREVSLMSGASIVAGLCELGARAFPLDPAESGWMDKLANIELAFVGLHGAGGEDGQMQGLLETLEIPYTGSDVLASALAMDKVMSKRLWRGLGLPTADFVELDASSNWQVVIEQLGAAFVKPVTGGSSIGTAGVENAEELEDAWRKAAVFGDRVIAERLIRGPEYTVSILGDQALPAISMETDNAFYDYEAKYHSDDTRYLCPCGLSRDDEHVLAELALRAFSSLGCAVWGRVDLMRDADGEFNLLEVNTVPGMTSHSLVPMAAAAVEIGLPELVGRIACLSLERGET